MVSIGLFAIILAGSWVSYLNFQRSNSLDSFSSQVLSTIYQAQNQAMSRMCTQNCDSADSGENFGVYFDVPNNKIILHRGITYNPGDEYNIDIDFANNLSLSENIQNSDLVFEKATGDVRNFSSDDNTFTLTENTSGETRNFTINRLGVIDVN